MRKNLLLLSILIIILNSCGASYKPSETEVIETVLNDWHQAAAVADEESFFNTFSQDGIYIGTDAGEYWTAGELRQWSEKAFEKDTAWAFTPYDRHIYFSADRKTAWFDELLKTWMGPCRGSGVMLKEGRTWKLAHYHLAVAVPNEKVEEYLELLEK